MRINVIDKSEVYKAKLYWFITNKPGIPGIAEWEKVR